MRPSITDQLDAQLIPNALLKPSPRNYNPSICEINGRVWMAYRSHRMERAGEQGRCGIAICETAPLVKGERTPSHWVELGGATGKEHHEDPRLFIYQGKLHIAFVETSFPPDRGYIAVQKYARLDHTGKGWKVAEVFRPRYGDNYADKQEKNWQFFERENKLHAIYSSAPLIVLEIVGDQVVNVEKRASVEWPWGEVRGGTPPVRWHDRWLTFFHSSTPTIEGAWRRYWMGAFVMDDDFNVVAITSRPLAGGSEADDHGHDPRVGSNWKPYVVFPGGTVKTDDSGWMVALGINDWRCAIAKIPVGLLTGILQEPKAGHPLRYFKTGNGSRPMQMMQMDRTVFWLQWDYKPNAMIAQPGYAEVKDPWIAEELSVAEGVQEVDAAEYVSQFSNKKNAA